MSFAFLFGCCYCINASSSLHCKTLLWHQTPLLSLDSAAYESTVLPSADEIILSHQKTFFPPLLTCVVLTHESCFS